MNRRQNMNGILKCVVVLALLVLYSDANSGTITKRLIGKQDIYKWDGVTNTFTVTTSTGRTMTMDKLDWPGVDVYGLYGERSGDAISRAMTAIGTSTKAALWLSPGTWTLSADLTITSNLSLVMPPGAVIELGAYDLTINGPFEAGLFQVFDDSGTGSVSFGDSSVDTLYPEWWGYANATCVQGAIDAAPIGTTIVLSRKYTVNPVTMDGVSDRGKRLVGSGGTDRKAATSSEYPELFLVAGADDNVLTITATSQAMCGIVLDNFRIDGNKSNQTAGHGLQIGNLYDLTIGTLHIRNCKEDGFRSQGIGDVNGIHITNLSVRDCDGNGIYLTTLADSVFEHIRVYSNGGDGIQIGSENNYFGKIHAYYNGGHGINIYANKTVIQQARSGYNDDAGVRVSNHDHITIDLVHAFDNGYSGSSSTPYGLYLYGASLTNTTIQEVQTFNVESTPTQEYGIYVDGTVTGDDINIMRAVDDGTNTVANVYIAGALSGRDIFIAQKRHQEVAYASSITPDPLAGEIVDIGELTGSITINAPVSTKSCRGHRLTFVFRQDATGGHGVTWDPNFMVRNFKLNMEPNEVSTVTFICDRGGGSYKWREASSAHKYDYGKEVTANVSNPPTDAELVSIFGQESVLRDGWFGFVDDSDSANYYGVAISNGNWMYWSLTAAP